MEVREVAMWISGADVPQAGNPQSEEPMGGAHEGCLRSTEEPTGQGLEEANYRR